MKSRLLHMKISLYKICILVIFLLIGLPQFSFALSFTGATTTSDNDKDNSLIVQDNSFHKFSFTAFFNDYNHITHITSQGLFTKFLVDGYGRTNKIGYPELPVNVQIIEIPVGADLKVNIISHNYLRALIVFCTQDKSKV